MPDETLIWLVGAGVLLLLLALWAIAVAVVYVDLSKRALTRRQRTLWFALVSLLPVIGLPAYLYSRLVASLFPSQHAGEGGYLKRVTMAMRLPQAEKRMPTIPMTNLGQPAPMRGQASVPAPLSYAISILEGPHAGNEYVLQQLPVRIGRGSDAAIRLDQDRSVSRKHAEIYQQSGVLRIRDLNSTHGTLVNGYSIGDKSLDPGDRITIGYSVMLVKLGDGRG